MEDGLVSNLGVVFAVWAAGSNRYTILLAGLASMFAGSLSMSAGSYLSSKSKCEVEEAEIKNLRAKIENKPEKALKDMEKIMEREGFHKDEIKILSKHYKKHSKRNFIENYVQKKLKIHPKKVENPIKNATAMFFAFSLGSLFPIFPFFISNSLFTMLLAFILTIIVLFLVGVIKVKFTKRHWFKSGMEIVLVGVGAGIFGYLIGFLFQIIF